MHNLHDIQHTLSITHENINRPSYPDEKVEHKIINYNFVTAQIHRSAANIIIRLPSHACTNRAGKLVVSDVMAEEAPICTLHLKL